MMELRTDFAGTKVVKCARYASRIRVDPDIPQVQRLKQSMLDLDHVDY